MKIAIPIWNNYVSDVFDLTDQFLLVEIENNNDISRSQVLLKNKSLSRLLGQLKNLEVDVLICGAISRALAKKATTLGIQVLPYVTGSIDDVIQAYLSGELMKSKFTMPTFLASWLRIGYLKGA